MKIIYHNKKIWIWASWTDITIGIRVNPGVVSLMIPFFQVSYIYNESKLPTSSN